MAQFDVYHIGGQGLVVDCQNDLFDDLGSRVVAPMREPDDPAVSQSRLNPLVTLNGESYRVATQFLRAVYARRLNDRIGSLRQHEYEIKGAIDMLISGF